MPFPHDLLSVLFFHICLNNLLLWFLSCLTAHTKHDDFLLFIASTMSHQISLVIRFFSIQIIPVIFNKNLSILYFLIWSSSSHRKMYFIFTQFPSVLFISGSFYFYLFILILLVYTVWLNYFKQPTHMKYLDSLHLILHKWNYFVSYSDFSHSHNFFSLLFLLAIVLIRERLIDELICIFVVGGICSLLTRFFRQ